jgi:aspartokinase
MTNIHNSVTNFIEQDVSIRRGLSRGFINSRALAVYIQRNLNLSCSLDAVISAIRRYEAGKESKEDMKNRYKLIASSKVSSRTRMVSILFRKDGNVRKSLAKLYEKIDFSKGEVLRILEVSQYIKIIIDQSNYRFVDELFSKSDIMAVDRKLGEISLIYSDNVIDTPGVFAALSSELALNSISIRDGVICGSEHIFIIHEDEMMKALQALHNITKWGERN